jgi:hypothetical protein|tara:strand:- start:510 stop:938 length:429 start_codon:yes stop_codon:yes gene_type:complete
MTTDENIMVPIQTEASVLVKTFGKPSRPEPDSAYVADVNLPQLELSPSKLDILLGIFDTEGVIASKEVKETLAILVLEAAKGLELDVDQLINFSQTQPGKVLITSLGIGMVNQIRPTTSQMGFAIPAVTPAKTELINRNIIA